MPAKLNGRWSKKHINLVDNHRMVINAKHGSYHFTGYVENAI